ncbi:hypothetical protein SERLA73DRAFT_68701 [Serpula lacrymans var. lacrymans S7.3]|uniref:Uncharacterized protein n=2 Tax=Serpula lacrymans var. lacrymans TaxID=341189 RepID=F8PHR1_SERL3|nr:uncharacterized protein SERLADRAFT_432464 [Serpula lacrymans var. lacrymans S7.9]EGO05058.1 hypothetical protein SERLA73DRAFT_68701 [Serpula lacrymans var. lacrymans S7.3]EGO30825.1 hypothetical protein SERLADRAFT_432464 [Serpula lacrymans var. lacrymans S7.9]
MAQSTDHSFVHLDETLCIYASPTANFLPYVPSPDDVLRASMHPRETLVPHWVSAAYSYIGFTPLEIKSDGLLTGCLKLPSKIPLEKIDSVYYLEKKVRVSWARLEDSITRAMYYLEQLQPILWPLDCETYPYIKNFGYLKGHQSEAKASKAALVSRFAFIPFFGLCSFVLAMFSKGKCLGDPHPPWARVLQDSCRVHPEWVKNL